MRRRLRNRQPPEHLTLLITDPQRRAGCTHTPPYHKHQLFTRRYTSIIVTLNNELTIDCTTAETLKVKGAMICAISPVNIFSRTLTVACKESKGKQALTEYENEKGENVRAPILEIKGEGLKTFAFEQAGQEGTDTMTLEIEGELKA
jgi:hypothetical protein